MQPKIIFTDKGLCEYRRTIMYISRAAIYWMENVFERKTKCEIYFSFYLNTREIQSQGTEKIS